MERNLLKIHQLTASDYISGRYEKFILPLGSLESHGPHLPFGTDTLTAYHLGLEIASRVEKTGVLPPVPYGMSEHYQDFPLTVSLRFETEVSVIRDILESLRRQGIRKVFILNGHDGNIASIEAASRAAKVAHPDLRIITLDAWWNVLGDLLPENFFKVWNGLGHGGEGELSMGLALFPFLCKPDEARGVVPDRLPSLGEAKWLFSELTDCGATGDPTKASREKGGRMRDVLVDAIVELFRSLDACDWDYHSTRSSRKH
jgi:creatinine amidohydrolase